MLLPGNQHCLSRLGLSRGVPVLEIRQSSKSAFPAKLTKVSLLLSKYREMSTPEVVAASLAS